jgi:preprotein translocase subunit YajC
MGIPTPVLAMAAPPQGGAPGNPLIQFLPLILIFVVFYFLLIAPARRKQKQHTQMLGALKAGDRVLTSGGIYGTVVGVTDATVQIRIADQVKVDVAKHAITELRKDD